MTHARIAAADELPAAVEVWRLANVARGKVPGPDRIRKVEADVTHPDRFVAVAVDDAVVGMAVATAGRADDGTGDPVPGLCHLGMVFVHPDRWGQGIGGYLLHAIAAHAVHAGYDRLQVWTGTTNVRAQRLYLRHGFEPTGRVTDHHGQTIAQYTVALPLA